MTGKGANVLTHVRLVISVTSVTILSIVTMTCSGVRGDDDGDADQDANSNVDADGDTNMDDDADEARRPTGRDKYKTFNLPWRPGRRHKGERKCRTRLIGLRPGCARRSSVPRTAAKSWARTFRAF